ncbi:MAG: hypothetical protein Q9168_001335 [Polycauliona sp. 1 TL-2023]
MPMYYSGQPVFHHDSGDWRRQQPTLPPIRDILGQKEYQPDDEYLSHNRQGATDVAFLPVPCSADAPLRRRPCFLTHEIGTVEARHNLESRSDDLISSDGHTMPREGSLGKKSTSAHRSDDSPLVSVTQSLARRWQTGTIERPRKRGTEAEALQDVGTAPKRRRLERKANPDERWRQQDGSKTAAIAHMEKERERRLHIGDLIKQIASLIQFSGPKVEILKRTVDCIQDAKSRSAHLETELEDLKRRYQSRAKTRRNCREQSV